MERAVNRYVSQAVFTSPVGYLPTLPSASKLAIKSYIIKLSPGSTAQTERVVREEGGQGRPIECAGSFYRCYSDGSSPEGAIECESSYVWY